MIEQFEAGQALVFIMTITLMVKYLELEYVKWN